MFRYTLGYLQHVDTINLRCRRFMGSGESAIRLNLLMHKAAGNLRVETPRASIDSERTELLTLDFLLFDEVALAAQYLVKMLWHSIGFQWTSLRMLLTHHDEQ